MMTVAGARRNLDAFYVLSRIALDFDLEDIHIFNVADKFMMRYLDDI